MLVGLSRMLPRRMARRVVSGERIIQTAVAGFDRALENLEHAKEVIADEARENEDKVAKLVARSEMLQRAQKRATHVHAKLAEILTIPE